MTTLQKKETITFSGMPEELKDILQNQPSETVVLDSNGLVDKEKSPFFYDWMVNG